MITTTQTLGFLAVALVLMAMHRMMIPLSSPYSDKFFVHHPKLLGIKKKMASFMLKGHKTFGRLAMVAALIHGAYNLYQGRPNSTGLTLLFLLMIQGALGTFAGKNPKLIRIHQFLPYAGLTALVFHILVK